MPTVLCSKERCRQIAEYQGAGMWRCANGHLFRVITKIVAKAPPKEDSDETTRRG